MRKIEPYTSSAPKLRGDGDIKYCLWVDKSGGLYVQILENDASGSFSQYLFSVSKYESKRATSEALLNLEAFNIVSKKIELVEDSNNSGFLKAVLRNLLPDNE
jgi:hypothetical protein